MSDITSPRENRPINRLLLAIGLVFASAVAAGSFLAVPTFRSTFSGMGFDLPWFTEAALSYYPAFFVVPGAVLAAWWLWPSRTHRGIACVSIGVGGSLLLMALLVGALQYPVFQAAGALGAAPFPGG